MTKAITYSSFAAASIFVILAFVTAKSYSQLAIGVVLFPALAYFALKLFPHRHTTTPVTYQTPAPAATVPQSISQQTEGQEKIEFDLDKRSFLKLAGTIGVSFFVFSLLGDTVKNLLFGQNFMQTTTPPASQESLNGSPQIAPTAGYNVSEIDEGIITYYGFTNREGGWLIMREETETSSFRYAKGTGNFPINWGNRKNLKYDYYYNLF